MELQAVGTLGAEQGRISRPIAGVIVAFNGLLLLWLLLKPGTHGLVTAVDNIAEFLGPLLILPLCLRGILASPPHTRTQRASLCLGLSILSYICGQMAFTYYEQVLHQPSPFPSWADAGFLGIYPFLLLGTMLLPARPLLPGMRLRLLLDGLMILVGVGAFIWYFLLEPVLTWSGTPILTRALGALYSTANLVQVACLLVLWNCYDSGSARRAIGLLAAGVGIFAVSDSVYDLQQLHGTYATGGLPDVCWPLSFMLLGLGIHALHACDSATLSGMHTEREADDMLLDPRHAQPLQRSLLPYAFVPLVALLAVYAGSTGSAPAASIGVYAGGALLVALVVMRQLLTIQENRRLYRRLNAAYTIQARGLARRVSELEWLRDLSRQVNAARTLDEVLDVTYDGIRAGLGFERVGLNLFNFEQSIFEDVIGTDAAGNKFWPENRIIPFGEDSPLWRFPGIAAVVGGSDYHYTTNAYAESPPELRYLFDGAPTYNLMVALRAGEKVVGMISVDNLLTRRPIFVEDADPLLAIANQVGMAVERTRAVETLSAREQRFRALTEHATDLVIVLDGEGIIRYASPSNEHVLGYAPEALEGCPALDFVHPDDGRRVREMLAAWGRAVGETPAVAPRLEYRMRHLDGSWRVVETITNNRLDDPAVQGIIVNSRDISERKQAEEALQHQALHDALTGLANRTLLNERLQHALRTAQRDESPLALLLIDLDGFKEVNDTLGHHAGDILLQEVGSRLKALLRGSDTVARLGGDEYAVLLPGTDIVGAVDVADKILTTLDTPFNLGDQRLEVGASIGIALSPDHSTDDAALLRQADVAMYVAKRSGGGFAVYDVEQDRHSRKRLALMGDLRQALAQNQFQLYYQPQVDIKYGCLYGVEALLRWHHPMHGFVPPDQFIPLAEQSGIIAPLTLWILEEAIRQCAAWEQQGLNLGMAVNLSMRNLHDPQLPNALANLLQRYPIDPGCLTLEITESGLMADAGQVQRILIRLDDLGVRIAIDDFGTGYSSLAYLRHLPVDELKIDKSFIQEIGANTKDATLVRSIAAMAYELGLMVVAEGVETQDAYDLLASLGNIKAQGYHISRPLPPLELARWAAASAWDSRRATA